MKIRYILLFVFLFSIGYVTNDAISFYTGHGSRIGYWVYKTKKAGIPLPILSWPPSRLGGWK